MFSNVITLLFYFFLSHFPSSTILTSARIAAVQIDDEDVLSIVLCKVSFAGYPLLLFLLVRIRDIRFGTCFFGTSCGVVLFPLLPLPGFRGVAVGLVLNSASTRIFPFFLVFVYHLTVIDCLISSATIFLLLGRFVSEFFRHIFLVLSLTSLTLSQGNHLPPGSYILACTVGFTIVS